MEQKKIRIFRDTHLMLFVLPNEKALELDVR